VSSLAFGFAPQAQRQLFVLLSNGGAR